MPKIISVHSFRGGTGKSNTTANLAATFALQGQRVGIVDADIQSPGIHVLFGLDEDRIGHSLNDYLWGKCSIEAAAQDVSTALGQTPAGDGCIYLIPSSIRAGEIARVLREGYDVGLLKDGFQALLTRLRLDYLLIDTHPGLNEETLLSITISDVLVIILRPDRQDFQGTAVTVDVARRLEVPQLLLVVNKVLPEVDFEALGAEVERTYQAPVASVLPLSDDLIRLASSDVFSVRYPDHPWTAKIRAIGRHIAG
jgi:MinD-like ATPase involved in chromosome partitioning or flagellar assembly